MADSLFDGRYRYDYIYPRGRSGETLRAVDTLENERQVVIKRPAPNDAPPIRAGQEVSILNERKVLTRLAGHPVLTALLGGGQFLVGGSPHQYIVMERGQGVILADMVRELATREERLPALETLVIVDDLLDLLQMAHGRDIVYNDVDAKHLFWDRDNHRLKVIDWGNAVFLEGDEITPQGVSRQSDVFQVGELLYFILTGGGRLEIPRDAGADFQVNFGRDAERVHSRLQEIISKAVHPNSRLRYRSIPDLRSDLGEYRAPLERERNAILGRVVERLRRDRSKEELYGLLDTLQPALAMDPGYPQARQAEQEIMARMHDLEVAADLDAARIYLESANWSRAVHLLDELRQKARGDLAALVHLLLDSAMMLLDANLQPTSPAVLDAMVLIFEGQAAQAAHVLLTENVENENTRKLQWLLAERISAHVPEVLLLRPNLYRLETALAQLAAEGLIVTEPRALLAEINATLESMPASNTVTLMELRDAYRSVVDAVTALGTLLETIHVQHNVSERKLPLAAQERALNATMALADNMHVIGKQATTSPRDALQALDGSRVIDPMNASWDLIALLLDGLYELLGTYQTYVPSADGSDLEAWLVSSRQDLQPFAERLFDEMLVGMIEGLEIASQSWASYANDTIQGNRISAITALALAIDAVGTVSPTLAGWLNQLRTVVTNAHYIERHALYGGLGRALADGWEAFDRGRLVDAERLGQQAAEIARSEPQKFAAGRLRSLSELARGWIERTGINNLKGTQAALAALEQLYLTDDQTTLNSFAAQMPSKDTYLRAMGKGLVELFSRSSTAAVRILFFNYILLGTLDAHEGNLDDATFWRDAALKTLGDLAPRHVATRTLDEFIERRRDINAGTALINQITSAQAFSTLESTRKQLEDNAQARILAAGVHSLRELEAALRDWSDGEFRAAGTKLENAIHATSEVEQAASVTLTPYRSWLMELQAAAAELHVVSRQMSQDMDMRPDEPIDAIREAHQRQVEVTERMLGEPYVTTLRQWRDTFESFRSVYTDLSVRRSERLNRFNQLFRAMFIDRHPAYSLYRHWYDVTERSPEFPAPPTSEPVPRIAEGDDIPEIEYRGSRYADTSIGPARGLPRYMILGMIGIALLLIVILVIALVPKPESDSGQIPVTISDTPTQNLTQTAAALIAESTGSPVPTNTLDPARVTPTLPPRFITPTILPTPLPPVGVTEPPRATSTPTVTDTDAPTATPSSTPTPSATYTPTATPTPTLPPQGLQGEQSLLGIFGRLTEFPWDSDQFSPGGDGTFWRLGVGEESSGDMITVTLPADLLETYFGNNAATRIRRVEAEVALTTFNPSLLATNEVFFGVVLANAANPAETVGLHVQAVQPGVIDLGLRTGEDVQIISRESVNTVIVRVRLDRDPESGAITVFYNGQPLGDPVSFVGAEAMILPSLYVKNGGVIVSVTNWTVTLR
jgi:hypothetical protein